MSSLLPAGRLQLNPAVAHPPFRWSIGLPETWEVLDTNPQTWQRSAERLVDEKFAGQRVSARERRGVLDFVDQLVSDCQRAGTVLTAVEIGRMSSGSVGSAGLHLVWYDSAPTPAGLAMVRDALPASGVGEEIETPVGPGVLHRDRMSMVPPGATARVNLSTYQVFLPLAGTTWTAVLGTAAAHPELAGPLEALIVAVARTIGPLDPADEPAASGDRPRPDPAAAAPEAAYRPVERPTGPGIERGFGTLILQYSNDPRPDHDA